MSRLTVLKLFLLGGAAAASYALAVFAVDLVENRTRAQVQDLLSREGLDWADVTPDGTYLVLRGTAPNEAERFRAITLASTATQPERVRDRMTVPMDDAMPTVAFEAQIMRTGEHITVQALVPAGPDAPFDFLGRLNDLPEIASVRPVITEVHDPGPEHWGAASDIAFRALAELDNVRVALSPTTVAIDGVVALEALQAGFDPETWHSTLTAAAPAGVTVSAQLRVPRRYLSPFTMRLAHTGDAVAVESCAVETAEDASRLATALAGIGGHKVGTCEIALGAPDQAWAEVAEAAIASLNELGGGGIVITDHMVTLFPEDVPAERLDRGREVLESALPQSYRLSMLSAGSEAGDADEVPRLHFTRGPDRVTLLSGAIRDLETEPVLAILSGEPSGGERLRRRLEISDTLPSGWDGWAMAAARALGLLDEGEVIVTPQRFVVRGTTVRETANVELSEMLARTLGTAVVPQISVVYTPPLVEPAGPDPELCVRQINDILLERKLTFAPGEAALDETADATLNLIAEVLRDCADVPMEIGGHTDNVGRAELNLALSIRRAEAVRDALGEREVSVARLTAQGYGEERPLTDNDTASGREANRRIAFRLTAPDAAAVSETADGSD